MPTEVRKAPLLDYHKVRGTTDRLSAPLGPEDQVVQSMDDVSPTKWHRAHVTWFFETFLLRPHLPGYTEFDPVFGYFYNSYYESVGERHAQPVTHLSYYEADAYARWADARLPTEFEWEAAAAANAGDPEAEANNQYVLRGGCAATPPGHIRATYRNFFPAHSRWMFSGLRLARTP